MRGSHLQGKGVNHRYVTKVAAAVALLMVVHVGTAEAGDPGYSNWKGHLRPKAPIPSSTRSGVAGGDVASHVRPGSRSRLAKRCVRRRRIRTCRFYQRGRIVKVCIKRPKHKERCRRFRTRRMAQAVEPNLPRSLSYTRLNSGYTNPLLPPVVRFYRNNRGWCSGTLVLRRIVLTAAHCLFANRHDGHRSFGYYPPAKMVVVPGNTVDGTGQGAAPYGKWQVVKEYVPQGWTQEDGGLDWGIAVVAPDANGNYPGDFTGTYVAYWNAQFPFGSRIFKVGYPYSGPFATADWFYGNGQYFCDNRWDGENGNNTDPYTASSYNLITKPCEMNGGSSGGPVFVQFADGKWGIIGVNDRGVDRPDGFGSYGISMYFDSRFGEFWNSVIAQINRNAYPSVRSSAAAAYRGSGVSTVASASRHQVGNYRAEPVLSRWLLSCWRKAGALCRASSSLRD
jgi:Trypsin-like peptidase domain